MLAGLIKRGVHRFVCVGGQVVVEGLSWCVSDVLCWLLLSNARVVSCLTRGLSGKLATTLLEKMTLLMA
jgi:hypothetical protein